MKKITCAIFLVVSFSTMIYSQQYVALAMKVGNNLWGYINNNGEFILPPAYKFAYSFEESGLAPIYDSLQDEVYYINLKGDTVLRSCAQFELLRPEEGGLMFLKRESEGTLVVTLNDKFGIIDIASKNIIVEIKYDEVTVLKEGFATGRIGNNYYLLTALGQETPIDCPNLKSIGMFSNGRACIELNNGLKGFIGTDGAVAIKPQFLDASLFANKCSCVKDSSGMYGVIDMYGNWVIAPRFRNIFPFEQNSNFTTAINNDHREVILSIDGKVTLLEKLKSCYAHSFSEGLISVSVQFESKQNKKDWYHDLGYIDTKGNLVIPAKYSAGQAFSNGLAAVRLGSIWGVIDTVGFWVIKPQFSMLGSFTKVKTLDSEIKPTEVIEIDPYDIVKFISIIDKLNYSDFNNNAWKDFFQQDRDFLNWLMSFRLDVNNFGLWQKANDAFMVDGNVESQNKSDSETAKILLLTFLNETPNYTQTFSYDEIEAFMVDNGQKEIDELRLLWRTKMQ